MPSVLSSILLLIVTTDKGSYNLGSALCLREVGEYRYLFDVGSLGGLIDRMQDYTKS